MKLKNLKLKNFAKFTDFELEFDGKITNLVGVNGSGKTTVGLTAIWACLKGISENNTDDQLIGERYRFIGKDKPTADIELTLMDESRNMEIKIRNHISKDANKITFDAPEEYEIDLSWVKNLLSVAFLSAKNFTQRSSKEQALLLGIDTKKFDADMKNIKQNFTYINRQISDMGEIKSVEKAEKVSISELLADKSRIDTFNNTQDHLRGEIIAYQTFIEGTKKTIADLLKTIEDYREGIKTAENSITELGKPISKVDTTEILDKIDNAEQINQKALSYQAYLEKKSAHDAGTKKLAENKQEQKEKMQERLEYIKSFDFGVDQLSVDDEGGLLLYGRPVREPYLSKGELEKIVAKLHAKKNPELKVRFIDDFELLDDENKKDIIDHLIESGFQIITAQVGNEAKSQQNTVLLRECKKVDV